MVSEKMVDAGNEIAEHLTSASITYQTNRKRFDLEDYPLQYRDLIYKYVTNKIDSVEAIYIAMDMAS